MMKSNEDYYDSFVEDHEEEDDRELAAISSRYITIVTYSCVQYAHSFTHNY